MRDAKVLELHYDRVMKNNAAPQSLARFSQRQREEVHNCFGVYLWPSPLVLALVLWLCWHIEWQEHPQHVSFLSSLVNGSFSRLEAGAGVVPFNVTDEEFKKLFVLVDGIYPRYSRFAFDQFCATHWGYPSCLHSMMTWILRHYRVCPRHRNRLPTFLRWTRFSRIAFVTGGRTPIKLVSVGEWSGLGKMLRAAISISSNQRNFNFPQIHAIFPFFSLQAS